MVYSSSQRRFNSEINISNSEGNQVALGEEISAKERNSCVEIEKSQPIEGFPEGPSVPMGSQMDQLESLDQKSGAELDTNAFVFHSDDSI